MWTKKKKKKEEEKNQKIIHDFIFITSLSLGVLVGWVVATAEGAVSLPLGSSLVGMGKIAKTNSMFWESTLSLERIFGYVRGLSNLSSNLLGDFFYFVCLVGLLCDFFRTMELKKFLGQGLFNRVYNVGVSIIWGGQRTWCLNCRGVVCIFFSFLNVEEASTLARLRASLHTWEQYALYTSMTSAMRDSSISATPML